MYLEQMNYFYEQELKAIMETGEISETFEELCDKIKSKIDLYAFLIDRLESEADYAEKLECKWGDYKSSLNNRREKLKSAIKSVCLSRDDMTITGNEIEFKAYKSGTTILDVTNESEIPRSYFKETIVIKLDKKLFMDDIKLGVINESGPGYSIKEVFSMRSKIKVPKLEAEPKLKKPKAIK